jgi:uncharacterized protein YbbC (DUF1343 family)/CubicO group peptidase (beta-lactamase class C family)
MNATIAKLTLLVLPASAAVPPFAASAKLDAVVREAITADQIPGAVLQIGHKGRTLHAKAYGFRSLETRELMTLDTIFDVASLTKVIATTSAVMKLFEDGKLRLNARVTEYLPDFQGGNSEITVRQLLTHFSGLRPDVDLEPAWSGYETGIRLALVDKPVAPPGARFIYSDINFILLGEIVRKLSGRPLPDYVRDKVFLPLGMRSTMFKPPSALRRRIAPTERLSGERRSLRGVVHDPTTRFMNGIAGHAGLFTTAADLARFAEMMLGMGKRGAVRVFQPATTLKFTTPQSPPDQAILRGLGWDIESNFSANRGELFPVGSYGHSGFTGTSLWIDPKTGTYVILLSNSVHPRRRPAITGLRARVATVTAAALGIDVPDVSITGYNETLVGAGVRRVVARNGETLTGLDVLESQHFAPFQGKRVGLITNHTGLTRNGERNVDVLKRDGVRITALFSPEHGLGGREDYSEIGNSLDPQTGIRVWSLYAGENRRPTDEMLRDIDVLVFDIQDVGARFYTYMCTMAYAMQEAATRRIPFWVLDRPNPITGIKVEGPILEHDLESFIGCAEIPVRHGMTLGEIARFLNGERAQGVDLHVIPMKNWQRGDWFDSTGLSWVDPSPNMRSLNASLLYPGVAMLEGSKNYSVGRGTDAPFEQVGADWIRGRELAKYLNSRFIPGVRSYATGFRPNASHFKDTPIQGIRFVITDREMFDSVRFGLEIAAALEKLYPGKVVWESNLRLIGDRKLIERLKAGEDPRTILLDQDKALKPFLERREKYLLYR